MKRRKIGDIIEIKTPKGFAYAQYIHEDKSHGPLIRVLPGLYRKKLVNLKKIVSQQELFIVFFPFNYHSKDSDIAIVGNEEVPERLIKFPLMKVVGGMDKDSRILNWWLYDGEKTWYVGKLPDEYENLPERTIYTKLYLIDRIIKGWRAEDFYK